MFKNGLNQTISLISNFMTSQPGYKQIVIQILPKVLRSKGNQTMKFGHTFLEKSYTKSGGETSSRPFSEKLKFSISQDQ